MMKKSKTGTIALGVAFVWFTTHFGGGFASGAQIYSYFLRYGAWCILMPLLAMAYNGVFFAYSLRFARKHQTYDYRSYNDAFYGRFAPIFSNLFELLYLCVMCVAPAVAFATGGATLSQLTGLPYLLCTLLIGVFIFVVAIFGTDLVRRVASVLSICIIVGLLIVYVPNIAVNFSEIGNAIQQMGTENLGIGPALYSAFIYGTFQLSNIAVFVQHAKSFDQPGEAVKSMAVGVVVNTLMMVMVVLGLMTIYTKSGRCVPERAHPVHGRKRCRRFLHDAPDLPADHPGAVSTAVNMVAAMVQRVCGERPALPAGEKKPRFRFSKKEVITALICCMVDFGIAQFGLLNLIQKAYSGIAYLAIPVILIPYIIHMIVTRFDTKSPVGNAKVSMKGIKPLAAEQKLK